MKTPAIASKYINTIPVILSTALVSSMVYFNGWTHYFSALILGIIAGGLVDLDNGLTGKLKNLFYTLLAFAVSSLSVQLTYDYPLYLTIALTGLAFIFTFSGAVGTRFRTISFGTLAVAVYTTLTHDPKAPLYLNSLLILIGTLVYSGSALLVHIIFPHRPVQENMAAAYESLARYLDAKAELFNPDEAEHLEPLQIKLAMANTQVITAFNQVRAALFYRMRGQHRHPRTIRMLRYYFVAQDIHERSSSSHIHYQQFAKQMQFNDLIYRLRHLMQLQADAARAFAKSLRQNNDFQHDAKLDRANQGAQQSLEHHLTLHNINGIESYRVARLLDNISHISHQFAHLGNPDTDDLEQANDKTRLQSPEIIGFKSALGSLKNQASVQSPVFRHAVRMSLITLACCTLIYQMNQFHIDEYDLSLGFWILLTAVFVCQPNYSATKKRLIQRIVGTVGGVLVGTALPVFALTLAHKLAIASLATILFFYFRTNKHSYATFFITIQALMGFSIMGFDITSFFWTRILDTLIGTGLAGLATYFLWPDWQFVSLDKTAKKAIQSNGGYLKAILNELQHGMSNDLRYRVARRASHDQAAALSSVLSDMSGEPEKHGARLQDGFALLKINYSLISYISALGAYRDKMHNNNSDFITHFYPAAEQTADVLSHIGSMSENDFQAAYQQLQNQLNALYEQVESNQYGQQNITLWQQLWMISELLPQCYSALHSHSESEMSVQAA
ncbi:YccS family putative transporter [Neisseriaceae bacterium B1]